MASFFDLIPAAELEIDQPDFKASKPRLTMVNGELYKYAECYEWANGKWEGFVSVQKVGSRKRTKKAPRVLQAA